MVPRPQRQKIYSKDVTISFVAGLDEILGLILTEMNNLTKNISLPDITLPVLLGISRAKGSTDEINFFLDVCS